MINDIISTYKSIITEDKDIALGDGMNDAPYRIGGGTGTGGSPMGDTDGYKLQDGGMGTPYSLNGGRTI